MSSQSSTRDVALYMKERLQQEDVLYQDEVASEIQVKFGDAFVYDNQNGNLAIAAEVLEEFKVLTPEVVWIRGERCWRAREDGDEPGRSQQ